MACFTVPLAAAALGAAAKNKIAEKAPANPFVERLGWLGRMMFGGSFLLAIEHVYHGEVTLRPPFLTAVADGPEAVDEMLREMALRGTAMTAVVFVAWVAMVAVSVFAGKRAPNV